MPLAMATVLGMAGHPDVGLKGMGNVVASLVTTAPTSSASAAIMGAMDLA